jgi:hypothetical protein
MDAGMQQVPTMKTRFFAFCENFVQYHAWYNHISTVFVFHDFKGMKGTCRLGVHHK